MFIVISFYIGKDTFPKIQKLMSACLSHTYIFTFWNVEILGLM